MLQDLRLVEEGGKELSLPLNHGNSEVISNDPTTKDTLLTSAPNLQPTDQSSVTLLGSPLGDIEGIGATIRDKMESLRTMGGRLKFLHTQDALLLLCHSLAIPKLSYMLRTALCFPSPELQAYNELLRSITSNITNISFQDSDPAWTQASLPVKHGGLGIQTAVQLAPSAFLASAAGSSDLVSQIIPRHLQQVPLVARADALSSWSLGHNSSPPTDSASHSQREWDSPRIKATAQSLLKDAPDERCKARLLATSRKESSAWLNALPVAALGLRMDDETTRVAVGLRLSMPLCSPHECSHCGTTVDDLTTHGLSCRWSEGRHPHHASTNDVIHRGLVSAKVPSRLEPSCLYRSDGKHPDGCSILPWKSGKMLVWDATCLDTYAPLHVFAATREAGAMAAQAEHLKSVKYAALKASHHFVPFVVETSGVLGQAALSLVWDLGQRLRQSTGEEPPLLTGTSSKEPPLQYRGGMQQQCSDRREAGRSLLGVTNRAPSPFHYCYCF